MCIRDSISIVILFLFTVLAGCSANRASVEVLHTFSILTLNFKKIRRIQFFESDFQGRKAKRPAKIFKMSVWENVLLLYPLIQAHSAFRTHSTKHFNKGLLYSKSNLNAWTHTHFHQIIIQSTVKILKSAWNRVILYLVLPLLSLWSAQHEAHGAPVASRYSRA